MAGASLRGSTKSIPTMKPISSISLPLPNPLATTSHYQVHLSTTTVPLHARSDAAPPLVASKDSSAWLEKKLDNHTPPIVTIFEPSSTSSYKMVCIVFAILL